MKRAISKDVFDNYILASRNLMSEFNNCWIGEDCDDDNAVELSLILMRTSNLFLKNVEQYVKED